MRGDKIPPRLQGDIGELSAMVWLAWQGAKVYVPVGHSPDVDDVVADFGDRLVAVQVKTSTVERNGRWDVSPSTRGGNRSWSGVVKYFGAERCDFLFVHVGDGRRWFIPSDAVDGGSCIRLGGPKYAAYEVERDEPLAAIAEARLGTLADPWRGSRAVKGDWL
ncbi:MAG: endonuclease [Solirubrobacteraceae bacterium]|nr:endonuclease [Solirubrobacteraceae bacterium]